MLLVDYKNYIVYELKDFDCLEIRKFTQSDDNGNMCSIDLIQNKQRKVLKSYNNYSKATSEFHELISAYHKNEKCYYFNKE